MYTTPLLLDFSKTIYPNFIKKRVPTSQQELIDLQEAVISSPNYYLKIYFPVNLSDLNKVKLDSFQINIPLDKTLNNQVRLALPPSIGYGLNSCYKVEYWEWTKPYVPFQFNRADTRIMKRQVYEEYWRVPTHDKLTFYDYNSWFTYKPNYKCPPKVIFTRGSTGFDSLLNNLDIINILSISQKIEGEEENLCKVNYTNYIITDDSLTWVPPFESLPHPDKPPMHYPANSTVAIEWLPGAKPIEGSEYEITYIKPLGLEDIVYIDDLTGKSALTYHPKYNYNYPFIPIY